MKFATASCCIQSSAYMVSGLFGSDSNRPGSTASLHRPGSTASLHRPGPTASLHRPGSTASLQWFFHVKQLKERLE